MEKNIFVVSVTGSAGNIGSRLLFGLPKLGILKPGQTIELRLFDLPKTKKFQEGLILELEDAFPILLSEAKILDESSENFKGTDLLIILSGVPRAIGQERKDLIGSNVAVSKRLAQLINPVAKPELKVLMVANPCNTNAYVFSHFAPNIAKSNIHSLSRLDFNRALSFVTRHPAVEVTGGKIEGLRVFGNHSRSMVIDFSSATVQKEKEKIPLSKIIPIGELSDITNKVSERGMEVIGAIGKSAGPSASQAIEDHIRDWILGSENTSCAGVYLENILGVEADIWMSVPIVFKGSGEVLHFGEFDQLSEDLVKEIRLSLEELQIEKKIALQWIENHQSEE